METILKTDVVVIGGGIVGTAIARELSKYELDLVLVEKEPDLATGTTKANSAILHAGFDAPHGSLKARTNVRGNHFAHPPIDDQGADTGIDKGGIVGDQCQVSDAGFKQGFHKAGRGAYPHKTANHDGHAVTKEARGVL